MKIPKFLIAVAVGNLNTNWYHCRKTKTGFNISVGIVKPMLL